MKTNKMMRVASVLLVAVLLTTCAISGTFAKYTSTATGSDTATVARWSFTVEGTNIAQEQTQTFAMDLFALPDTNVEQTNGLIAPGTEGSIALDFANTSQVNATYTLTFVAEKSDATLPVEFKLDDGSWTSDITTLKVTDEAIAMNTGTAAHTLYWRWVFDGDDAVDTKLGIDAAAGNPATCIVTATVVANQVD